MAKFAILDIFSGMPNPVWPIGDDVAASMQQASTAGAPASPALGYRGFRIVDTDSDGADLAAVASSGELTTIAGSPDAERTLLNAGVAAGVINADLAAVVGQAIDNPPSASEMLTGGGASCPPNGGTASPSYDPAFWNDPARIRLNNCYAYANNKATNTFPQPGRGSGQMFTSLDCDGVRSASERDGLVTTGDFQASREGAYVALVIWPGQDYHWYRQDDTGCWSHKPGQTPARNVDNSGRTITDPQQCDRGPYTVFCTFMVTNANVTIA